MKIFYSIILACILSFEILYAKKDDKKETEYIAILDERSGKIIYLPVIKQSNRDMNNENEASDNEEIVYETKYEMMKRILEKNKLGIISLFLGVPVAQGAYVCVGKIDSNTKEIHDRIKTAKNEEEKRKLQFIHAGSKQDQPWYIAYPSNWAQYARISLSIYGLKSIWTIIQDIRKGPKVKSIKKKDNQNS